MRLTDRYPHRRAFITGAASGLGLALCRALAAEGWTLGMADLDEDALYPAAEAIRRAGGTAHPVVLDVRDAAAFQHAADAFVEAHDGVDLVINNAGIAGAGAFEEIPAETWKAVVEVDLLGVAYGCRAFAGHLRRAGRGHLLNVASIAAVSGAPRMAPYNAAKAGVLALSETLYGELKGAGVHVSVVLPSFFQTDIASTLKDPAHQEQARRLVERSGLTADEVAHETLRQAGRGKIHILYPREARLIWHFRRLLPATYVKRLVQVAATTTRYIEKLRSDTDETA